MDPYVEDVLRHRAPIGGDYVRLAEACEAGRSLATELAGEAAAVMQRRLDALLRPADPDGPWVPVEEGRWVPVHGLNIRTEPVEDLHELATTVQGLLDVGALDRAEAAAFLRGRAAPIDAAPPVAPPLAIAAQLEAELPGLTQEATLDVLHRLVELGLLDEDDAERRRLASTWREDDHVYDDELGDTTALTTAPEARLFGVRVLAVEETERGVVLHVHDGRARPDARGARAPQPGELAADDPDWPWGRELRLHDDLGTTYRGTLPTDPHEDIDAESSVFHVAFVPAVPAAARALWLGDATGAARLRLR